MNSVRQNKKKLHKIRTQLLTHYYLAPTNFPEEKIKFFKDHRHNPQFLYPYVPLSKFSKFEEEIENLTYPKVDNIESRIYKRIIEETKLKLRLLLAIGTPSLLEISRRLYQLEFKRETLESAKCDAAIKDNVKPNKKITRYEIRTAIKNYFMKYGIKNWKIILTDRHDFSFQILPKSKLIKIGFNLNSDLNNLEYALAHEIDGHVMRALNAAKQKSKMHKMLFPFYIKTEEGLASFIGDYFSSGGEVRKKLHAISYLAAHFAMSHSFSETYKFLTDYGLTLDTAFQKTFRLKRGIKDSESHGVFAREAIYYEGMLEVKNYLEDGGDIRKLYAGKVSLDMLNYIPIPKNQILPNRLLNYLN